MRSLFFKLSIYFFKFIIFCDLCLNSFILHITPRSFKNLKKHYYYNHLIVSFKIQLNNVSLYLTSYPIFLFLSKILLLLLLISNKLNLELGVEDFILILELSYAIFVRSSSYKVSYFMYKIDRKECKPFEVNA